jgi:hypothetical protein
VRTAGTLVGTGWARVAALAAIALWLVPGSVGSTDFAKYHNYQDLSAALKALATAHPDLARLVSIGKTLEGRDLWAIEIASSTGTPIDQRPALLIAANLEGDHLIGSELALYVADYLLGSYPSDAAVKQRLDSCAVYIVPRVNPDGAEQMFSAVKSGRRTNSTPFDADNDGRLDEDGAEDLNKDGYITVIRVKDPKGPYMISPEDPRLMKKADPAKGEAGGFSIYWEGTDKDTDGFIAEDGPGGVDINRNFMHRYPYYQPDSGRHMVSEAETRAMLEYLLKHRNIAAILAFGESDNLIVPPNRRGELATPNPVNLLDFAELSNANARKTGLFPDIPGGFGRGMRPFMEDFEGGPFGPGGPGGRAAQSQAPATARGAQARQPATTVNTSDLEYFTAISNKYRELTGIRSAGYSRSPAGALFEYGYYQYGVPSFSTPGWGLPGAGRPAAAGVPGGDTTRPAGETQRLPGAPTGMTGMRGRGFSGFGAAAEADTAAIPEGIDLRLLQWMDNEKIDGFANWTPFVHPTLGQAEIGGFKPYAITNPAASKIADLGAGHAKFALYLTSLFPRIKLAKTEVTALGTGLYRIKAEVENTGFLPTALAHGVAARAVKPVMVQLDVPPETIITGNEKTNSIPALAGSGNRQSYQWVIRGKPGSIVTLKVISQKSGTDTATLTLQ